MRSRDFFLFVSLVLSSAYMANRFVRETFVDSKLDRVCALLDTVNLSEEVREKCLKINAETKDNLCVVGCDPVSLCGLPASTECMSTAEICDITHHYIGDGFSAYNEEYPRMHNVKEGLCIQIDPGTTEWIHVRFTGPVLKMFMRFPWAISLPYLHEGPIPLTNAWSVSTAFDRIKLPLATIPERPADLLSLTQTRPSLARSVAFAHYHTSTEPFGLDRSHREYDIDEFVSVVRRETEDRRPASPNRVIFFYVFDASEEEKEDEISHTGFHSYAVVSGTLWSAVAGSIDLPNPQQGCRVLVQYDVDCLAGGYAMEVREIVRFQSGMVTIVSRKLVPQAERIKIALEDVKNVRCFMGSPDPDAMHSLLKKSYL